MTHHQETDQPFRILAVSGSLRAKSSNTALLRAMAALAPANVIVTLYNGLGDLPYFNPDLDVEGAEPPSVLDLRAQIGQADGLLISTPEYAHGIPGVLKNGLDWLVSSVEFPGKPVALIKASARPAHAYASLGEILTTMSAQIIPKASVTVPLTNNRMDETDMMADPVIANLLTNALNDLVDYHDSIKSVRQGIEP